MIEIREKQELGIVLPVSNTVLLPGVTTWVHLNETDKSLAEKLESKTNPGIALPLLQNHVQNQLSEEDFHKLGVLFSINQIKEKEKSVFLHVTFSDRVQMEKVFKDDTIFYAHYKIDPEVEDLDEHNQKEILSYLRGIVHDISQNFQNGEEYTKMVDEIKDMNTMIAYLSQFMQLSEEEKYSLLKTDSLKERSLHFMDLLLKQKEAFELNIRLNEKLSKKANRFYREQVLREQLKAIQEELNEGKEKKDSKEEDYREKIERADMPDEVKKAARSELEKLNMQGGAGAEESVIRNYLDFLIALPWKKAETVSIDLKKAQQILNQRHYGLEKVKERILQQLAVMKLKKNTKGSILLLVGPPGTGKTSLGKSIAEALGRKYVRLSLGGIRDEAEIRGHRRTYVGALPGSILKSMKKAGTTNPVMVLDEIDKIMQGGFSGDPASALLEVLDPEQNNSFTDHYLDLPYDLSDVFFIATANSTETIPEALLDRMEVISISGYTAEEKFHIGKTYLMPSVLQDHGLLTEQLMIEDDVLKKIITDYTLEAGVRGLKKQFAAIARAVSEKIVLNEIQLPYTVKTEDLEGILGHQIARHDMAQQDNPPGVVTGLAWTPVGGEILFIEATDMPGSGNIVLTGKLGDVMKESAMISLSLLKSRLPVNSVNFKERDIHVHVPSGAVPKDGPSAGIALFTALASLFTGIKVDAKLGMTGEITLRGAVLPIGGLKEKLLAAQRAGIQKVLIPSENVMDLKDLPDEMNRQMEIVPVETVEDVLRETIGISLPRINHMFFKQGVTTFLHN